ncbi:hypothetical protein SELMODRAFT_429398 [Selaginella moellendorffii]|uniref:Uncharacterized protein n=1 Tax=Selaginella moellendorffii TaxID=88036 RepID=D8T622_SELML|nr:hypothetical protein SELMODRAFT_429398 [Selaginella moellendorffii]
MAEMEGVESFLKALWDLPLTAEEKARIHLEFMEMPVHLVARNFIPPTPQDKAATLRSFLKKLEGKERVPSNTYVTSAKDPTSKRQRVISRYKPVCVEPATMLGQADRILVALRWLYLLVEVQLTHLRTARLRKMKVAEADYYPAILCFLEAASFGQEGLHFGGEGQGKVKKSDLQGFVSSKMKAPTEVKTSVKHAKDSDPTGVESNALLIGQEAEYLESTEGDEPVAMGCLFCRMDRFWVVKYLRQDGSVEQLALMNPAFILMKLRDLDDSESRLGSVRLCDILPGMPSAGFSTLVAYMEQLREIHGLRVSVVRFRGAHNDDISISDLNIVAYGRKSLILRCCLDPHLFPACMRMAVEDALRKLGLDQEQNDEDNEDEENEDEDEDDDEEG